MTTDILSRFRDSTRARAPVLSISIRFWINVDSLNRPPTLLTIPSSFRSSSIRVSFVKLLADDFSKAGNGRVEIVVDHLVIVFGRVGQFALGGGQTTLDCRLVFSAAFPQALLVGFQRRSPQEDRDGVRTRLPDLRCPLHVDVQNYSLALRSRFLDFAPKGAVAIAVDACPLQERPGTPFCFEAFGRPEMVVH